MNGKASNEKTGRRSGKELERLIENSTGKLKIYKDLKKSVVSYLSLSQKIGQIFEEYGIFIGFIWTIHI